MTNEELDPLFESRWHRLRRWVAELVWYIRNADWLDFGP